MIFVLPFIAQALHLPAGVGAPDGTSEFATRRLRRGADLWRPRKHGAVAGTTTGRLRYTLVKVVGRDVWIGIWAFVLAIIATRSGSA